MGWVSASQRRSGGGGRQPSAMVVVVGTALEARVAAFMEDWGRLRDLGEGGPAQCVAKAAVADIRRVAEALDALAEEQEASEEGKGRSFSGFSVYCHRVG